MSDITAYAQQHGISYSAAYKRLHPEKRREYNRRDNQNPRRRAYKTAWERKQQQPCERCGELHTSRKDRPARHCNSCERQLRRDQADLRFLKIEQLWQEGKKIPEIARELGTTNGAIHVAINSARDRGYDLPFRRPPRKTRP